MINGREVMDRVKRERDRFVGFVLEGVDEIPAEDKLVWLCCLFMDDNTLQIDDHTIVNAKRIVIATGSRPAYPAVWDELGDRLIINDDVFNWDDLPQSVAVFGPGVIGLELGQATASAWVWNVVTVRCGWPSGSTDRSNNHGVRRQSIQRRVLPWMQTCVLKA